MIKTFAFIILVTFLCSCRTHKSYSVLKVGNEIILNGHVPFSALNDPKKFPWYFYGKEAYQPDTAILRLLAPFAKEVHVLIFGGTWCGDTQVELPKLMKVMDRLKVSDSALDLIMLDRKKQTTSIKVSVLAIDSIPMFLFYQNGREIFRIKEHPHSTFEKDMLDAYQSQQTLGK